MLPRRSRVLFIPPPVSGSVILLDFRFGVNISGSNIASVADQSGHGNHFTAIGAVPYAGNGIAGTPCADTRASSGFNYLQCVNNQSAILTGAAAHRFMVFKPLAGGSQTTGLFSQNDGSAASNTYLPYVDGNFYDEFFSSTRKTVGAVSVTNPIVYDTVSSGSEFTASVNGAQVFTTASNTVGASTSAMTLMGGPSATGWQGLLAYFLVYPAKISGSQYTSLIAFLRGRGNGF